MQSYYYFIFVALLLKFQNSESLPSPALDVSVPGFHTTNSIETKQDFLESVYTECADKGSVPCFKYKLFAFVDKILNKDEINLANGITVVKTASSSVDGAPRSLDKNTEATPQNGDVGSMLVKRIERFLSTHTLKVDLRGTDVLNAVSRAGRTLDEFTEGIAETGDDVEMARKKGGGKKKGAKILGPLLMMIKMKLLGLIPLAFGLIALIAGKALLIGKIALLLSLIIALKKLLAHHQKTVTYEIVSHPHSSGHEAYSSGGADYSSYGGGGGGASSHGGWGRSSDAHDLAYKAYKPASAKLD